jgi:hypothetical protein
MPTAREALFKESENIYPFLHRFSQGEIRLSQKQPGEPVISAGDFRHKSIY